MTISLKQVDSYRSTYINAMLTTNQKQTNSKNPKITELQHTTHEEIIKAQNKKKKKRRRRRRRNEQRTTKATGKQR